MAPRFAVTLMIGRTVTAEIEARDPQAAEDIVDVTIEDTGEGAAS